MTPRVLPARKYLLTQLEYEPRTGLLWWLERRSGRRFNSPAGSINSDGYIEVTLDYQAHLAHRLIWWMYYNEDPVGWQVDHEDGNRSNNRIRNLRLVDQVESSRNSATPMNSSSDVVGVNWDRHAQMWLARIKIHGTLITLGRTPDKDEAVRLRKDAEYRYRFHENHGRDACYKRTRR